MRTASSTVQEIIDGLSAHGDSVSPREIERYRAEGLIPPPIVKSLGRGNGTQTTNGIGTVEQLVAMRHELHKRRNFDDSAFILWADGWLISLPRVRTCFSHLLDAIRAEQRSSEENPAHIRDRAESIANKFQQGERARSSMRRRSSIEEIQALIETATEFAFGGMAVSGGSPSPSPDESAIDRIVGLERARELLGSAKLSVLDLAKYLLPGIVWLTEASDIDLVALKRRYLGVMRVLRSPLLTMFGLEELADRSFHESISFDLLVFYVLAVLRVAHPDFDQRIDSLFPTVSG